MSLTHRFLNADAFASTGQGLLGNNMFAYCGNNPVNYADPKGNLPSFRPVYFDHGENQRIYNQRAEPYASKILGDYTVSYNGCGAIATFNALVALGNPKSLDEALAYYNGNPLRTFMNGKYGMLRHQVARFFNSEGYRTDISCTRTGIENNSKTADACIMFYVFPQIIDGWTLPGAHFVQYETCGNTYVGYNTGLGDGFSFFESPVDYGLSGDRCIVIGIFIFED